MDIRQATGSYEAWLAEQLPRAIHADLEYKHTQMAAAVFPFLRATSYRWAQRWPLVCPHLTTAPTVLGVADLHVENFGTWRDSEGRLVWGINDFDEATDLPYPADLVRLATSGALATEDTRLSINLRDGTEAILAGYQQALSAGGRPVVLAEGHTRLRRLASGQLRDPVRFWTKLQALPLVPVDKCPPEAVNLLTGSLPGGGGKARIMSRRAGLGSLGRPRLVAIADWKGGAVAREVKALLPSTWAWAAAAAGTEAATGIRYSDVLEVAVRCPDPATSVRGRWLVRRLAPDCTRIELADLPAERDESHLLHSMGWELANVHLGTPGAGAAITADLSRRPAGWLAGAAEMMAADTRRDWMAWRA